MFNNAQMIEINGKEVKSIVLQDGGVLYEKENTEPLILYFKGDSFQGRTASINNMIVNWGDGVTEEYLADERLEHTYNENTTHIITISNITTLDGNFNQTSDNTNKAYGITKIILPNNITQIINGAFNGALITDIFIPPSIQTIGDGVFTSCSSLKNIILSEGLKVIGNSPFAVTSIENIIIPSTVTSIGTAVFGGTGQTLKSISFLWNSEETIIPYNSSTYAGISPDNYIFNIPEGTTQLYVDKGYPLEKLVEKTTSITLTSDKDIVKVGETTLLTASLSNSQENETVYINKIIDDENLTLELTSINDGLNHTIKTKVIDENDNGLENIRIKLFKEE